MALISRILLHILVTLTTVLSANFQRPVFNDSVVEIKVVSGQTAFLPCTAQNKAGHSIIWMSPKHILMSKDEQIVVSDSRISVERPFEEDWNLRILRVRHNDSGQYTCQINTSPVKIKRVYLFVQVPSHIVNKVSSGDMDVEEGDDVELICQATGVPQPNITWYRRPLFATEGKDPLNVQGERLIIQDIRRYQSGMYICLAYNDVHPATSRQMEVKVQYPPVVKLLNTKLGQSIGKDTILECSVTSYPTAKINWIKNGVPVNHNHKYRIEFYPSDSDTVSLTLHIIYINRNDYGDYTCEANNRMGTDKATMVLYEYRPPTMPTTKRVTTTTVVTRPTTPLTSYDYYWGGYDQRPPKSNGDYPPVLSDQDKYPWQQKDFYYYDQDIRMPYSEDYSTDRNTGSFIVPSSLIMAVFPSVLLSRFVS